MCWWIFKKKSQPSLVIPHPEEPINPLATLENTFIEQVFSKWFIEWEVPIEYYPFWLGIDIKLAKELSSPAATFSETKQMYVKPEWANPSVIAHEIAHISYSLLTDKSQFTLVFNEAMFNDELLKYLWSVKPYMRSSIIETHADIYRYLGEEMPKSLKTFYPNLF